MSFVIRYVPEQILFHIDIRPTKYVVKLFINILMQQNFFPHCYKTLKCAIKPVILILLQHNLFLNVKRNKKYELKLILLILANVFHSFSDRYKFQKMCDRVVSEDPLIITYCTDRHKTQKVSHEAADNCLAPLKFILFWFATSKMKRIMIL